MVMFHNLLLTRVLMDSRDWVHIEAKACDYMILAERFGSLCEQGLSKLLC
jgi:hypothetical protein